MPEVPRALRVPAAVLVGLLIISGCSCRGSAKKGELEFPERTVSTPDLSNAGTVLGEVAFQGTPPRRRAIEMSDAWCRNTHPTPTLEETVVVENGMLRDVFVHVTKGIDQYTFDHEKTPAVMDQKGCLFVPHVLGVRAYQPITFHSSDQTQHNVNTSQSAQGFNQSLGAGQSMQWQFKKPELFIAVRCNIHPWMVGYVNVVDHPYFAVTGPDGKFDLGKLPPGRYTVEAVHQRLGRRAQEVTVEAGGTATLAFTFTER